MAYSGLFWSLSYLCQSGHRGDRTVGSCVNVGRRGLSSVRKVREESGNARGATSLTLTGPSLTTLLPYLNRSYPSTHPLPFVFHPHPVLNPFRLLSSFSLFPLFSSRHFLLLLPRIRVFICILFSTFLSSCHSSWICFRPLRSHTQGGGALTSAVSLWLSVLRV